MSAPPLPPTQAPPRKGKGTCIGCGIAFAIIIVVLAVVLVVAGIHLSSSIQTDDAHNSVVGSAYVGDWQDVNNPSSVIQISPNGSASCMIVHGMSHYSINGGRATFDKKTEHLSIKFFFLGPSWHVDQVPHQTGSGVEMTLDGQTFRKTRAYPSPSGSPGSGVPI